jgi:hypothetical protein
MNRTAYLQVGHKIAWATTEDGDYLPSEYRAFCEECWRLLPDGKATRDLLLAAETIPLLPAAGEPAFPAGFVGSARALLEGCGRRVRLIDRRRFGPGATPAPVTTLPPELPGLAAADKNPCGVFSPEPGQLYPALAALCRLFPAARIVVPVEVLDQIAGQRQRLAVALGAEVGDFLSRPPAGAGVSVGTLTCAADAGAGVFDVAVVPDALCGHDPSKFRSLLRLRVPRVYGFAPRHVAHKPEWMREAWAVIGPALGDVEKAPVPPGGQRPRPPVWGGWW